MKYQAVIFDLYGTLVSNGFASDNSLKEMAGVLSAPEQEFANIWNAGFKKRMTTISQLKTKVHKIGLLSNCSSETIIVWDETPFTGIFDITVFSCAVGLMKPDPRIYHIALEKLQVKPNECLYIADGMDGELKAAAAVGMTPVRINFPHANKNDPYLEDWHGATISSLNEVLDLVK
jgi:putative hydrolase of the HAD superfamily